MFDRVVALEKLKSGTDVNRWQLSNILLKVSPFAVSKSGTDPNLVQNLNIVEKLVPAEVLISGIVFRV